MKVPFATAFVVVFLLFTPSYSQRQTEKSRLQLVVTRYPASVCQDESFPVFIKIRNLSDKPTDVDLFQLGRAMLLRSRDGSETFAGEAVSHAATNFRTLAPGQSVLQEVWVSMARFGNPGVGLGYLTLYYTLPLEFKLNGKSVPSVTVGSKPIRLRIRSC